MRQGSIPSQWFGWANSWEPSLLLEARERLMKAGIKPEEASESQVQAAVGVVKASKPKQRRMQQKKALVKHAIRRGALGEILTDTEVSALADQIAGSNAMATPTETTWEIIDSRDMCGDTCRLEVPGGWLYRERESTNRDGRVNAIALTFVPKPKEEIND